MPTPARRATERLHLGRESRPFANYFVTFVTAGRRPWLSTTAATDAMLAALRHWHAEGDGAVLVAVVMPDHVHVLFRLGQRLTVGQCVARWKAETLRASRYAGGWQRDFWEHRVRDGEPLEDYGLYVLLNPHRAGLASGGEAWSGGWLATPSAFGFPALLEPSGGPPREWVDWPESRFATLVTGA